MEKLSELTGMSGEIIIAIAALLVIGLVISLFKKIVGIALTVIVLLVGIYLVFGYTPSQTVETVKEKTATLTENFENEKFLNSLDELAVKINEEGTKYLESEDFKVYYDENGKQVVEDLKTGTTVFLDELKQNVDVKNIDSLFTELDKQTN